MQNVFLIMDYSKKKFESYGCRKIQQGPHACYALEVWAAGLGSCRLLVLCGELEGICPLVDLTLSMTLREMRSGGGYSVFKISAQWVLSWLQK